MVLLFYFYNKGTSKIMQKLVVAAVIFFGGVLSGASSNSSQIVERKSYNVLKQHFVSSDNKYLCIPSEVIETGLFVLTFQSKHSSEKIVGVGDVVGKTFWLQWYNPNKDEEVKISELPTQDQELVKRVIQKKMHMSVYSGVPYGQMRRNLREVGINEVFEKEQERRKVDYGRNWTAD